LIYGDIIVDLHSGWIIKKTTFPVLGFVLTAWFRILMFKKNTGTTWVYYLKYLKYGMEDHLHFKIIDFERDI